MGDEASFTTAQLFSSSTPINHESGDCSNSNSVFKSFLKKLNDEEFEQFFEIASSINWISENCYKRVALQFPDTFLPFSKRVCDRIESQTQSKTFVLADTSYRSCCVDEVAAAHANCDALIHYGEACLSVPTLNIPVKYIFGKFSINMNKFSEMIEENLCNFSCENLLILVESIYSYDQDAIYKAVKSLLPMKNVELANLETIDDVMRNGNKNSYLGRSIPSSLQSTSCQCDLIFCGLSDSPILPLWLLSYPQCISITHFDPSVESITHEISRTSRLLRKRLFLIEKLKDANTVGLVVGSVGVDRHRDAVKRMRLLCKTAQKKIYVISVGKINVPKLSNFSSDIDVFVLLSCPFGVLLDSSEFYRPVLSFFEAEIALNPCRTWAADGGWSADFSTFLDAEITEKNEEEDGMGDMSLVSGKVRVQKAKDEEGEDSVKTVSLYTAGDYFNERSWKGLDDSVRIENDTTIQEGRSGIAQGYDGK